MDWDKSKDPASRKLAEKVGGDRDFLKGGGGVWPGRPPHPSTLDWA